MTGADDIGLRAGDTLATAMLSPCVGGLVRTWTDAGASALWSVTEADYLHHMQGIAQLSRSPRGEGRFREVGLLSADGATLSLMSRFPRETEDGSLEFDGSVVTLGPAQVPAESTSEDFLSLLDRAVRRTLQTNEYLIVEKGGWDAPFEPYCLFIAMMQEGTAFSVIETAPAPHASEIWSPSIVPGEAGADLRAPLTEGSIDAVAPIMLDAISTWGLAPWDLALTFGARGRAFGDRCEPDGLVGEPMTGA